MARVTIKVLQEQLAEAEREREEQRTRAVNNRAAADDARSELKKVRENFGDLKERLHNAEVENARLRGYLARVHDADVARDGLIEVLNGNERRSVPRWQPPLQVVTDYGAALHPYMHRDEKRQHWTSY